MERHCSRYSTKSQTVCLSDITRVHSLRRVALVFMEWRGVREEGGEGGKGERKEVPLEAVLVEAVVYRLR
jgi:hypothetical protein